MSHRAETVDWLRDDDHDDGEEEEKENIEVRALDCGIDKGA